MFKLVHPWPASDRHSVLVLAVCTVRRGRKKNNPAAACSHQGMDYKYEVSGTHLYLTTVGMYLYLISTQPKVSRQADMLIRLKDCYTSLMLGVDNN